MPGEFDFIDWIRRQQSASALVQTGIGDDLAALNWPSGNLLLVGVDQILDGVHFDSAVHSPRLIGRKAMNRNLSDCAAMGSLPAAALVSLALPKGVGEDYAKELYLGIKEAGDIYQCPIVGGDTGAWPGKLAVTVSIMGSSNGVAPITRAGAKPGDVIYVTGPLGGSIGGRHMTFEPRVPLGRVLAEKKLATAMIDLSDGLSRDLAHICRESGVGAVISAARIPIHPDVFALKNKDLSPLEHALHDGEDYELLFTSSQHIGSLALPIGVVESKPGISLQNPDGSREPIQPRSWQHAF